MRNFYELVTKSGKNLVTERLTRSKEIPNKPKDSKWTMLYRKLLVQQSNNFTVRVANFTTSMIVLDHPQLLTKCSKIVRIVEKQSRK